MTYISALTTAIERIDDVEVTSKLIALRTQLENHAHKGTTEAQKNARKAKTAAARSVLVSQIAPIIHDAMSKFNVDMTAQEIYDAAKTNLPSDFSRAKVQNILIREMAPEIIKTERKGKPNVYRLAKVEVDDPNQFLPHEVTV